MDRALYFPYTTPRDQSLLKEALILWDKLEFIVPWRHFDHNTDDEEILRALEVVGQQITPSEAAKERCHVRLKQLIGDGLPGKYLFRPDVNPEPIYAEKLLSRLGECCTRET